MQVSETITPERAFFRHMPDLAALLSRGDPPAGPGHWVEIERTDSVNGMPRGNVILCHGRDVYCYPRRGLLLSSDGKLLESTVKGSRLGMDRIARLPGMHRVDGVLHFDPPKDIRTIDRATVWMNFGAGDNYGHFLFDALPALGWTDQAGLLAAFPPIAPRLGPWQTDLLRHAGISDPVHSLTDPVVRIGQVIYTSCLNHYLHRNGGLFAALAARFTPSRPDRPGTGRPVYFSRRGFSGRIMVNEGTLEAALAARGVTILRPEKMTVAAQIAAVAQAPVIIGASGAALANLCFLGHGARMVELRPDPVREPWLDLAAAQLGIDHRIIRADGPLPRDQVPFTAQLRQLPRRMLGKYHYAYRVDIEQVLQALGD